MRKSALLALALLALALCAACGSAPKAEPPPAQGQLAQAEARAAALVRSGDTAAAARGYHEALRIATSLEDVDAIAANAINLSVVYQWLGHNAEARKALAVVVDDPRRPFPERRRLQAELRAAIVELAMGERTSAAALASRAAERCAGGCDYAATILNVEAQIALSGGDTTEATRRAQGALERSRGRSDSAEAANALRTLGRAARQRGDAAAARPLLEQALELDRALADPRKILADLTELSRAAAEAGEPEAAKHYAERAAAVGRALDDNRGIPAMEATLGRP
jgi:tetratricopeptide (TPR) repeat protein